jgi:hypothetical protein
LTIAQPTGGLFNEWTTKKGVLEFNKILFVLIGIGFFLHLVSFFVTAAARRNSNGSGIMVLLGTERIGSNSACCIFAAGRFFFSLLPMGLAGSPFDREWVSMSGEEFDYDENQKFFHVYTRWRGAFWKKVTRTV